MAGLAKYVSTSPTYYTKFIVALVIVAMLAKFVPPQYKQYLTVS